MKFIITFFMSKLKSTYISNLPIFREPSDLDVVPYKYLNYELSIWKWRPRRF